MKIITFDIGGTGCQWILFENNVKKECGNFSTEKKDKNFVIEQIAKIINSKNDANLNVGISSPTAINIETGYSFGVSGIKEYGNFNLYMELSSKLLHKNKIKAINDANAALLGTLFFEKESYENAALITIGTGIGGALFINGKILSGKNGFAGEFGYLSFKDSSKNISQNCSTRALIKMVFDELEIEMSGVDIWNEFKMQNKDIIKILNSWISNVVSLLKMIVLTLNVDVIYIGGGVSKESELISLIKMNLYNELKKESLEDLMPKLKQAFGASEAGLYGALSLWKK